MTDRLLKAPNVNRGGRSVVVRGPLGSSPEVGDVISKIQDGYYCRPLWNGFRRTPLVRRELRALQAFHAAGVHVPEILSYEQSGERARLVTQLVDGLHLKAALDRHPDARARILINVGREIGKAHRAAWTHGALYDSHILVSPDRDFRVCLVDLEKAHRSLRMRRDLARLVRRNPYLSALDLADVARGYLEFMPLGRALFPAPSGPAR